MKKLEAYSVTRKRFKQMNVIIVDNKQSLVERLQTLKALQEAEKAGDNDPRYISDLELSIGRCEVALKA